MTAWYGRPGWGSGAPGVVVRRGGEDVLDLSFLALARIALDQNTARLKNQEQQIALEVDLTDEEKVMLGNSIKLCSESIEEGKKLL